MPPKKDTDNNRKAPQKLSFNGFKGFYQPRYTMVPDEVFDELLAFLSGAELKILLYICRRTFGFKKDSDNISLNQMLKGITKSDGSVLDHGIGVSKPVLLRSLKTLVEKKVIISERRSSPEKGNQPTNYRLNFLDGPLGKEMNLGGDQKLTKPLVKKPTPQETVLQDTPLQKTDSLKNVKTLNDFEKNSLNEKTTDQDQDELEYLVEQILDICEDPKSKGFYRRVAKLCPRPMIFETLSIVRDLKLTNQLKRSAGAAFTKIIQRKAEQEGIDLQLQKTSDL